MTLDATKPADSDFFSIWAYRERETRAYVNAVEASLSLLGAIATSSEVTISGGTSLDIDTNLDEVPVETVFVTAAGAETLATITGGTQGQLKIFIIMSGSLTITYGATTFALNNNVDVDLSTGDVIAFVNFGGDAGVTSDGYWKEIFRTLKS